MTIKKIQKFSRQFLRRCSEQELIQNFSKQLDENNRPKTNHQDLNRIKTEILMRSGTPQPCQHPVDLSWAL
ncbi:hypothetical protein [Persicobacter diffluens]|uniref:Uncharacterized protein n=1 Tax=Persicobacter diffluens TaxID=981 RepID=A0AAN4VYQ2_9BACT|nr:hypothetical protein PEDI_30630 [Persicobacter diffluens]